MVNKTPEDNDSTNALEPNEANGNPINVRNVEMIVYKITETVGHNNDNKSDAIADENVVNHTLD